MKRFLCKKSAKNAIVLFMIKFKTKPIIKNNPGSDKPVFFWFKIPAENRVYPSASHRAVDPTETRTF